MPPAATVPTLLVRLMRRRRRVHRQQEPADMGTAFGMEQWLGECDLQHPAPVARTRARRAWLPRWLQGSALR